MVDLLNIILPTFIVIFIGYLLGKTTKIDMSAVVEVVFYVGLPSLAFVSMLDKKIVLLDAAKIWAAALIIMLGGGMVAWSVFKIIRQKHSGLYIPIMMMNTVNIPFPIIYLVYGSEGLFAATLFYIPNVLLLFSLGIYIASKRHWQGSIKEVFRVPAIYAAIAGLMVNLFNVTMPELIVKPLDFISLMVIPLVLLVLGYNLSKVRITSLPTTLLASFIRLGVGLLLGLFTVNLFGLTGVLRSVVILDSAMPAAVNASLLATKYKNEADLVSSVVFITTIASLVIIPFLLHVLS
ncbi:MAG: AEC family transporter [Chloroflexi bacterium]|nr:AEC family transporter [Chloroflexota bacterium]